jgi:hypothetical protein
MWWFLDVVLIAVLVLAVWSFYRRRHARRGPNRSGRARSKYNVPPNVPPPN